MLAARPPHVATRARRRLFRQSLSLQSFEHFRTSAYTRHVADDIRIGFEIYRDKVSPVHDRKGVGIGDREVVTHKILALRQLIIQIGEPIGDRGLRRLLGIVRGSGSEEWRK